MTRLALLVSALLLSLLSVPHAGAQTNGGFEASSDSLQGWERKADCTPDYVIKPVAKGAHGGKQCALVESPEGSTDTRGWGAFEQHLDVNTYRGKHVIFQGYARSAVDLPPFGAGLWMRVDCQGGRMGFFDNMMDRLVRSGEWSFCQIEGDVAEDAESILIGGLLLGPGKAWFDDFSVSIVDQSSNEEPSRPLTDGGLDNLVALARVAGVIHYFHPSDEAANTGWDSLIVRGVRTVEDASGPDDLSRRLNSIFLPIAPTVDIHVSGSKSEGPSIPVPDGATKILSWEHHGYSGAGSMPPYHGERVSRELNGSEKTDASDNIPVWHADLPGGVTCSVPLAVYADSTGTLPRGDISKEVGSAAVYSANDRATRLATVILAWNVFQHFAPYLDASGTDWNAALRPALAAAAEDSNDVEFLSTLRKMTALARDGHVRVRHWSDADTHFPPIGWEWVGDRLVVTAVGDSVAGIQPGDVVVTIDGVPVEQRAARLSEEISAASKQYLRRSLLRALAIGPKGSRIVLEVSNANDGTHGVELIRSEKNLLTEHRPDVVAELDPGIWYVDIDRLTNEIYDSVVTELADAKAVIFDFRGYPRLSNPMDFFGHLSKEPMESSDWQVPIWTQPDRMNPSHESAGRWNIEPIEPIFRGKLFFLINDIAISYSESCLSIVDAYHLGTKVGSCTAGTNGNVSLVKLPAGYSMMFTGLRVIENDGSLYYRTGICPDVPVEQTVTGIREGKDEVLDAAVKLAEQGK